LIIDKAKKTYSIHTANLAHWKRLYLFI